SNRVSVTGSPPAAEIRNSGSPPLGAKMITPSEFHVPPRLFWALANDRGGPPSMSRRFSLPSAKNPSDRLSGDQEADDPNAAAANGRAVPESRRRSHRRGRPSEVATKTIFCPSGETANDTGSVVGGVAISRRISGIARGGWYVQNNANPPSNAVRTNAA